MFGGRHTTSLGASAVSISELIYVNTVQDLRKSHRNAIIALASNIMQAVIMVAIFYIMFSLLGLRGVAIRGDFLLYVMTGIFMFLTHVKAQGAVFGADGPSAAIMKHLPMTTAISMTSAALSALYIQILSIIVILTVYNAFAGPIEIQYPIAALSMVILAWASGVAVGLVFVAIKPWAPGVARTGATIYRRANMVASGKMFVANSLPGYMVAMFDWNPLFHIIDQTRGYTFINYNPFNSSLMYPIYVTLALVLIGLLGEFYTRKNASLSWEAGR